MVEVDAHVIAGRAALEDPEFEPVFVVRSVNGKIFYLLQATQYASYTQLDGVRVAVTEIEPVESIGQVVGITSDQEVEISKVRVDPTPGDHDATVGVERHATDDVVRKRVRCHAAVA